MDCLQSCGPTHSARPAQFYWLRWFAACNPLPQPAALLLLHLLPPCRSTCCRTLCATRCFHLSSCGRRLRSRRRLWAAQVRPCAAPLVLLLLQCATRRWNCSLVPGSGPVGLLLEFRAPRCCASPLAAGAASLPSLEAGADAAAASYLPGNSGSGSGGEGGSSGEWYCGAYVAPAGSYCQRANTLQGYADVNRRVPSPCFAAGIRLGWLCGHAWGYTHTAHAVPATPCLSCEWGEAQILLAALFPADPRCACSARCACLTGAGRW